MPDGPWTRLRGDARARLERTHRRGQDPLPGQTRTHDESSEPHRRTGRRYTIVDTYSDLTYQGQQPPNGIAITHTCDKCSGHTDQVVNGAMQAVVVPPSLVDVHAQDKHRGTRTGTLFQRVLITGKVTRRVETYVRFGNERQRRSRSIVWEERTINHVERRVWIEWGAMSESDCTHGVQDSSLAYFDPRGALDGALLAAVRDADVEAMPISLFDDEAVLAAVEADAAPAEVVVTAVSGSEDGLTVALAIRDLEGELRPLGKASLEVLEGGDALAARGFRPA